MVVKNEKKDRRCKVKKQKKKKNNNNNTKGRTGKIKIKKNGGSN